MEKTLVLIKPESIQRQLIGKIITRFEEKGFQVAALKFLKMNKKLAADLYKPHLEKSFYRPLINHITSGPVVAMVLQGLEVINSVRQMMGSTNPLEAPSGTIRGDWGLRIDRNIIHGSDSPQSAKREIPIFFKPLEIINYKLSNLPWL